MAAKKNGNKKYQQLSVDISNQKNYDTKCLKKAEERAKESMIKLCIADDLEDKRHWEFPPLSTHLVADDDDSSNKEASNNDEKKVETKAEEVKVARKNDVKKVVDKRF